MTLLFHLSDLHLSPSSRKQGFLLDRLVQALARERAHNRCSAAPTIVVTGDVFDAGSSPPHASVTCFLALHDRIVRALGGRAPTIVLPATMTDAGSASWGAAARRCSTP